MSIGIADLSGVRAKLRRADEHNRSLISEFNTWIEPQTKSMFNIWRDGTWYVVSVEPFPEPDIRFSMIAGDIIHNLRCALDHLVCQLVFRDGNEPSWRNEFPIYDTQDIFFNEVKFRKKNPEIGVLHGITVDGDAWTIIEEAQPYKRTHFFESPLRVIKKFSNVDKHRTFLPQLAHTGNIIDTIGWNPDAILLEQRIGTSRLSFEKKTEVVRYRFADKPDPKVHVKGDLPIEVGFSDGREKDSYRLGFRMFHILITEVTGIVNKISKLPRIIDV